MPGDRLEGLAITGEGPIRTVTLDRPRQRNAVDAALHRSLAQVWRRLAADREVRVVVLTGAGDTLCAGGDLEWIEANLDDPAARDDSLREGAEIIDELLRFPCPVIAAVNGPAVGLGCTLSILCDIVLMADTATLVDPHVTVGLAAGDGGAALWPLLGPILRSREFLFTGDPIPAATAVELGLATRCVAPGTLMDEAQQLAGRLARQPALALQETKRVVNMHLGRALAAAVPAGFAAERHTMEADDHRRIVAGMRSRRSGRAR